MISYYILLAVLLLKVIRSILQFSVKRCIWYAIWVLINFWLLILLLHIDRYLTTPSICIGVGGISILLFILEIVYITKHFKIVISHKTVRKPEEYDLDTVLMIVLLNNKT